MPTDLERAVQEAARLETPGDALMHPEWIDGKRLWIEPDVKDLCDRIQDGCSCGCGWEGDPRMAVYQSGDGRWEIKRLSPCRDADCEFCSGRGEHYFTIGRSRPGLRFDHRVIEGLVLYDTRRGFSIKRHIEQTDDEIERRTDAEFDEVAGDASDKLAFAFSRNTNDPSKAPKTHIV